MKELDFSKPGLQLYGFNGQSTPSGYFVNWTESRVLSVSQNSYKAGLRFLRIFIVLFWVLAIETKDLIFVYIFCQNLFSALIIVVEVSFRLIFLNWFCFSQGWPYYLNRGTHMNISYNILPKGSAVRLVITEG